MKNYYFVTAFIIAWFSSFAINAQSCPPTGFSDGDSLFFFYDSGTSLCMDRPNTVSVGSSIFTQTDCGDIFSVYELTTGSAISPTNMFTADFGYGTCEYTDGALTGEFLSLREFDNMFSNYKIFPNPIKNEGILNIKFEKVLSGNIKLIDITGKIVLEDSITNSSRKTISLNKLNNGIYLLQITNGPISTTKKVVIIK